MSRRVPYVLTSRLAVLACACAVASCNTRASMPATAPVTVRPLKQAMTHVGRVQLAGSRSADMAALCVTPSGRVFAADSQTKTVATYAEHGALIRRFAGAGETPGLFTVPWAITVDALGRAYVLDIKQSRIHVFDAEGRFDHVISFGATGIMGQDLIVDGGGQLYLGGYQRGAPRGAERPTVHRLAGDGRILGSFYPLDPRTDTLNLRRVAGVRLAQGPGDTIYAAQVTGNEVVQFRSNGERIGAIGGPSTIYRGPMRMPPSNTVRSAAELDEQFARWTQLIGIIPGPDGQILVYYSVHTPVKYAFNIYQRGALVLDGVGTDHLPVSWQPDGRIMFIDTTGFDLALQAFALGQVTSDR